jgi:phage/plasmid-associated DNA primase
MKVRLIMNKDEKMVININIADEGVYQKDIYSETTRRINTDQIRSSSQQNKDIMLGKNEAIAYSFNDEQQYEQIMGINRTQKLDIFSIEETDLSDGYYKERRSSDKGKLIKANLTEIKEEKKTEKDKQPIEYIVTAKFLAQNTVNSIKGQVRLYDKRYGYFKNVDDLELEIAIKEFLPKEIDMKLTKYKMSEVKHRIRTMPELQIHQYEDFDNNSHLINFRDLVYDTNTGKTYPHNPNYLFTATLMPTSKKVVRLKFLNHRVILRGAMVDILINLFMIAQVEI